MCQNEFNDFSQKVIVKDHIWDELCSYINRYNLLKSDTGK